MAEQKLEKWQNRSQEKGVLWTPMNHISNIPFNFCQKKIAIKNVLRYKHKIKSENKALILLRWPPSNYSNIFNLFQNA